ncbi:MAG: polysaccharide biosynthesis protein [Friedmanniella sp.]|nr:polysaccharide biosynthesis protein [Friedmanniella sp.]
MAGGDLGPVTPPAADPAPGKHASGGVGDLFGRGMVYVVVWSMQLVVGTLVSPVLAHLVKVADFGALSAAIALFQLLIVLTVFGLDQALEIQRLEDTDGLRARGLLAAGTVLAFTVTAAAALTAHWWGPALGFRIDSPLLLVTLLWTAPGAVVLLTLSILQAEDRLARFATVSLVSTVGSQVLGIALLFVFDRSIVAYAWGGVAGQWLGMMLGLFWTRPRWRGIRDLVTLRRAVALGIPLVLASLSQFIITAGDRFIIQRYLGEEQVARYQVAFTVGNVMALLLTFTNRAWLPRLKSIVDPERRWQMIGESRDGIYWLLGWALLGLTVGAAPLLRIFAPASYEPSSLVVVVFLIGLCALPVAAGGASSRMLITVRQSAPLAWSAAAAVVAKIAATLLLLRWLGLPGVAAATLVAVVVQTFWLRLAVTRRHGTIRSSVPSLVFLGICVVLSGATVYLVPQTYGWNVARFVFGAVCLLPFLHSLDALRKGRPVGLRTRRRAAQTLG